MNTKHLLLSLVAAVGLMSSTSHAVPIQGMYLENPALCDFHPPTLFSHELGDAAVFPLNEGFLVNVASTNQTCCVPDDGFPNDFDITITNISGFRWVDLFFVVDTNVGIGNVDGLIQDITVPGYAEAFKIDNVGVNNNLVSGDVNSNLIFDLGEAWTFRVTNFVAPANLAPFPAFLSPGGFAASSTNNGSNASIVANQFIPEPGAFVLFALAPAVPRKPSPFSQVVHPERTSKYENYVNPNFGANGLDCVGRADDGHTPGHRELLRYAGCAHAGRRAGGGDFSRQRVDHGHRHSHSYPRVS